HPRNSYEESQRMKSLSIGLGLCVFSFAALAGQGPAVSPTTKQLHERTLVLDTHLDTPANLEIPGFDILSRHDHRNSPFQVDLPLMIEGGLDGGFWVIFTAQGERSVEGNRAAREHGLMRLAAIREMVAAHPQQFELALTADDAERIAAAGKRVVFISME